MAVAFDKHAYENWNNNVKCKYEESEKQQQQRPQQVISNSISLFRRLPVSGRLHSAYIKYTYERIHPAFTNSVSFVSSSRVRDTAKQISCTPTAFDVHTFKHTYERRCVVNAMRYDCDYKVK